VIGDAEFFLLDGRYYRDDDSAPDRQSMLGEGQMTWLKNVLKQSRATFKVIALPRPALAAYEEPSLGAWQRYPEGKAFIAWLMEQHITGVVFISGGLSKNELSWRKAAEASAEYPLLDLSSAPLSRGMVLSPELDNPARLESGGTDPSFGTVEFGGPRAQRFFTLRLRDAKGKVLIEKRAFATELR